MHRRGSRLAPLYGAYPMKTPTQRARRSLLPVLLATAGLPERLRRDRLLCAARDQRVPAAVWVREIERELRRRAS